LSEEPNSEPRERRTGSGRARALAVVSIASIFALAVWFSTNAVAPALEVEKGLDSGEIAWLTIAVQFGFAFGTLVSAVLNLADRFSARRLFAVSAIAAAALNLLVIPVDDFGWVFVARFATGAFLAGVYPPAMKILAGWFERGRGFALGMMIAALTLGSGSPHLLRSIFVDNWEAAIIGSSILAAVGGLMLPLLVSDGPHDTKGAKFNPRYLLVLFTNRGLRLTLLGYLGHMWELYALWAWIGAFMLAVLGPRPLVGDGLGLAALVAFLVFAVGAAGSVVAGLGSDRYGRTLATIVPMVISGSIAFFIGFIPLDLTVLIVVLAMVWGASVIADSAQFSTAVTELSEPAYRGTVLTFQTGLGFGLTAISIRIVPWLVDGPGWGVAFAVLGIGPVVGTAAMLRLRSLPEANRLAGGRR
jgi:sugar phosphate permease